MFADILTWGYLAFIFGALIYFLYTKGLKEVSFGCLTPVIFVALFFGGIYFFSIVLPIYLWAILDSIGNFFSSLFG